MSLRRSACRFETNEALAMDGWSVQQQGNPKRAAAKKAVVSKAAKAIAKIGEKLAKLTVRKI